jgi:lysophospholipase L1-like esterase
MLSVGVNLWRPSLLGGGVSLPRWQAALAAQQAGTRNANVLFVGDSTTFGLGGGTGGSNETNCKNNCFVSMLIALVANSSNSSWFGDASGGQASFATYDARIGSEGSWQLSEDPEGFNFSVPVLGGPALVVPSGGGTSPLTFTPTNAVDTFVIYYLRYPGSGGLNIYIDGTLQTNVSEDIASGTGQASVTVTAASAGTHTVGVASDGTAANVFLCGIRAYNSAVKEISLMNAGWSGSTANNWVNPVNSSGAAYAPLPTISAWAAPDLTFIDLTINDWRGDGSGNYSDEIQAIITQAQTTGDVVLMTGVPSNGIDQAFMQGFVDTILSLATANNCPVIDFFSLWGKAWVSSWMYNDFHPNATGYAQQAPVIANMIGAGAPSGDAAQTTAFLARTSGLSGAETAAYKALINGLVSNDLFSLLDALYIFATKDTTTANLNLISTSYALTQYGTVTFSADYGYTGDGSTGYFDTRLPIGVGNFHHNSQTLGVYVRTNRTDTATAILEIGWSDQFGSSYSYISPRQNALGFVSAMESVNCTAGGPTNSQGAWTTTRTASNAEAAYLDAGPTPFATASGASVAPSGSSLTVLIGAGTFGGLAAPSPDQISAAWIGAGLTGTQVATLHSLINAYMTALGINVY